MAQPLLNSWDYTGFTILGKKIKKVQSLFFKVDKEHCISPGNTTNDLSITTNKIFMSNLNPLLSVSPLWEVLGTNFIIYIISLLSPPLMAVSTAFPFAGTQWNRAWFCCTENSNSISLTIVLNLILWRDFVVKDYCYLESLLYNDVIISGQKNNDAL